jgi:hypothetical protein
VARVVSVMVSIASKNFELSRKATLNANVSACVFAPAFDIASWIMVDLFGGEGSVGVSGTITAGGVTTVVGRRATSVGCTLEGCLVNLFAS